MAIAEKVKEAASTQITPETALVTLDIAEIPLEMGEVRCLSDRDRDIFLALLEADPEPTEAAREAAARFNQGRHDGAKYHFKA